MSAPWEEGGQAVLAQREFSVRRFGSPLVKMIRVYIGKVAPLALTCPYQAFDIQAKNLDCSAYVRNLDSGGRAGGCVGFDFPSVADPEQ